jgi:hypothetical protein
MVERCRAALLPSHAQTPEEDATKSRTRAPPSVSYPSVSWTRTHDPERSLSLSLRVVRVTREAWQVSCFRANLPAAAAACVQQQDFS